jgi:hypothetical protein
VISRGEAGRYGRNTGEGGSIQGEVGEYCEDGSGWLLARRMDGSVARLCGCLVATGHWRGGKRWGVLACGYWLLAGWGVVWLVCFETRPGA